jgi:Galactose oxidase, central domain/Kelch motif
MRPPQTNPIDSFSERSVYSDWRAFMQSVRCLPFCALPKNRPAAANVDDSGSGTVSQARWNSGDNKMIARTVRRLIQWSGRLVLLALALCLPLAAHAVTNTWSPAANLAAARSYQTATLLPSGKVLVAGGGDLTGALSGAEVYDSASNTWSPAGQLATARDQPTATLLPSGKVLVVGGADGNGLSLASAELYDPASNTWSTAGSLVAARYGHTATLLPSGKVLVVGGASSIFFLASAELYDPASNTWSAAGFPRGRARSSHRHAAALWQGSRSGRRRQQFHCHHQCRAL